MRFPLKARLIAFGVVCATVSPLPAGELSHNFRPPKPMLLEAKKLTFREDAGLLVDPAALDFRPPKGSPLVDAGCVIDGVTDGYVGKAPDVGAYEHGGGSYWIPGRQAPEASMPIPPDRAKGVRADADLIWLGGYRGTSYDVYFGTDANGVAGANHGSPLLGGNRSTNIYTPPPLRPGAAYYWRVDTVTPGGTVRGRVWRFECAARRQRAGRPGRTGNEGDR